MMMKKRASDRPSIVTKKRGEKQMSSDEDAPETGKEKFYEADDVEEILLK